MEKVQKAYYMLPAMRYSRMQELAMMEALEEHAASQVLEVSTHAKYFQQKMNVFNFSDIIQKQKP